MLRITWRLQAAGVVVMSAWATLLGVAQAAAYNSAAGGGEAQRQAFGSQMEVLGRQISYIFPLPVRVDTMAGYLQWRVYGALPLLFAAWALFAATGAMRGDEERGLVEQWRAAGVGPLRYVAVRFTMFMLAASIAIAVTSAAVGLIAAALGAPVAAGPLVEISVALLALTGACYGIAAVAAQLAATRSSAAGLGGAVLGVVFFIDSFSRTIDGLRPVARLVSPFFYYDRSVPLAPGGAFDLAATALLFAVGVVLAALAAWLMGVRDLGGVVPRRRARGAPATRRPSPNVLLGRPVATGLYEHRLGLLAWSLAAAVGAAFIASIGRQIVDLVNGPGGFRAYLTVAGHGDPYVAITGFLWFGVFQLLLAMYVITQVGRWTSEDDTGRLEMILSAPISRTRVVLERALTLLISIFVIVAVSSAAFSIAAAAAGIHVRAGDLATAGSLLLPLGFGFAAIGAVLASWVPRQAVGVLATVAFLSFLLTETAPLLKWPDWTLNLSYFSLYGAPLTSGVDWTGLWVLLAVVVIGFGTATVLMQRRNVGS